MLQKLPQPQLLPYLMTALLGILLGLIILVSAIYWDLFVDLQLSGPLLGSYLSFAIAIWATFNRVRSEIVPDFPATVILRLYRIYILQYLIAIAFFTLSAWLISFLTHWFLADTFNEEAVSVLSLTIFVGFVISLWQRLKKFSQPPRSRS